MFALSGKLSCAKTSQKQVKTNCLCLGHGDNSSTKESDLCLYWEGTQETDDLTLGVAPAEQLFRCELGENPDLRMKSELISSRRRATEPQADRNLETAGNS